MVRFVSFIKTTYIKLHSHIMTGLLKNQWLAIQKHWKPSFQNTKQISVFNIIFRRIYNKQYIILKYVLYLPNGCSFTFKYISNLDLRQPQLECLWIVKSFSRYTCSTWVIFVFIFFSVSGLLHCRMLSGCCIM